MALEWRSQEYPPTIADASGNVPFRQVSISVRDGAGVLCSEVNPVNPANPPRRGRVGGGVGTRVAMPACRDWIGAGGDPSGKTLRVEFRTRPATGPVRCSGECPWTADVGDLRLVVNEQAVTIPSGS